MLLQGFLKILIHTYSYPLFHKSLSQAQPYLFYDFGLSHGKSQKYIPFYLSHSSIQVFHIFPFIVWITFFSILHPPISQPSPPIFFFSPLLDGGHFLLTSPLPNGSSSIREEISGDESLSPILSPASPPLKLLYPLPLSLLPIPLNENLPPRPLATPTFSPPLLKNGPCVCGFLPSKPTSLAERSSTGCPVIPPPNQSQAKIGVEDRQSSATTSGPAPNVSLIGIPYLLEKSGSYDPTRHAKGGHILSIGPRHHSGWSSFSKGFFPLPPPDSSPSLTLLEHSLSQPFSVLPDPMFHVEHLDRAG